VIGSQQDLKTQRRRRLVRAACVLVYIGLIALVLNLGKGHTLILDNKDAEDGSVKALDSISVSVDGQDPTDLSAGDRDMAKVRGQGHVVDVTIKDGPKVTRRIHVPLGEDMLLLSLPKLLAGQPAVSRFVPKDVAPTPEDQQGNNNAFTSPDAPAVPGAPAAPVAPATPAVPAP